MFFYIISLFGENKVMFAFQTIFEQLWPSILVSGGVIFICWYWFQRTTFVIKNYSDDKFVNKEPDLLERNHRNRYRLKKVPKDLDAIVIGSGIGGLTCAGLLSRAGKRVLVLEQHYIAGGSTHAFKKHGFEFDTGLHYMGNISKRKKILDLITENPIEWDQMGTSENGYVYDEIEIGHSDLTDPKSTSTKNPDSKTYWLPAGHDAFVDALVKHFPDERETIERYLLLVKQAASKDLFFNLKILQSKWLATMFMKLQVWLGKDKFFKLRHRTARQVIEELTDNKELQTALMGQFGDYGRLPSEESFFVHASVVAHYLEGGYYPRGGSTQFAKQIIPTIQRTGGACLVNKRVEQILVENGKAVGVKMEGGDTIYAPQIIAACGVPNTYKKLLPSEVVPKHLLNKIEQVGYSCSMVYLFVGLKGTPEELKLRSANIWHWPSPNYKKMLEDFNQDPENAPIPLFIGFPCAKDSDWSNRYPGRSNAVILTMINYDHFKEWADKPQGKRGKDYDAKKKVFEKRILEGLFYYYPHLKDKITHTLVGTPVTFNHYIASHNGEVYGLKNSPERYQMDDWLRPKTNIPGLYLTGQDVTTLGITGAMMAGVLTAHSVLGYGTLSDLLTGRNLIKDLQQQMKQQNV